MKFVKLSGLAAGLFMTSACAHHEPPRTVSDFCLIDKKVTVNVAPQAAAPDPQNIYDSDETVLQVLTHNNVHAALCGLGK